MTTNLSKGPVQVFSNDVLAINVALSQIQNEIDEIRGLRGRSRTYDRLGVDNPTIAGDAATLSTVQNPQFSDGSAAAPSQSYKDDSDLGQFRIGDDNEGFASAGVLRMDYNNTRLRIQLILDHDGTQAGFFNTTPVSQQTVGAVINNVTSGGTDGTIDDFSDLVVFANSAPTIRNDLHQLARSVKQMSDALRNLGLGI